MRSFIDVNRLFVGGHPFFCRASRNDTSATTTIVAPRTGYRIALAQAVVSGDGLFGGGFILRWHDGSQITRNIWGDGPNVQVIGLNGVLDFTHQPEVADDDGWRLEWVSTGDDLSITVLGYFIPHLTA